MPVGVLTQWMLEQAIALNAGVATEWVFRCRGPSGSTMRGPQLAIAVLESTQIFRVRLYYGASDVGPWQLAKQWVSAIGAPLNVETNLVAAAYARLQITNTGAVPATAFLHAQEADDISVRP